MKKMRSIVCLLVLIVLLPKGRLHAQDPITLIIQQGIKKVIVAVDLKIQRLQNRVIWLQNAQKVVENTVSKLRLAEISDWVEKHRDLYSNYFDELWKVKDMVSYYHKVRDVSNRQILLVSEYKKAWSGVQRDKHFAPGEITYIGKVYSGIMKESLKNLEQVITVIQSFSLQMTDAKRIELINSAADALEQNYIDLKTFSNQNVRLSLQRSRDEGEIAVVRKLYGIQ
jgi:predicted transcriptional regulator YheO